MFAMFEKGGPIMWPLLLASITGMTVVFERILFVWMQKAAERKESRKKIFYFVERGELDQAKAAGEKLKDPVVKMLISGLKHKQTLQTALYASASTELKKYERGLPVLDTIITLAPLLGLLGTVTGMIRAFGLLGGAELEAPAAITGGIAEALIATAFGLGIAIFCLIPFNWLNAYVENMRHQMENAGSLLESLLAKSKSERGFYEAPSELRQAARAH